MQGEAIDDQKVENYIRNPLLFLYLFLQSIHKLRILTICKIQPFLILRFDVIGGSANVGSFAVLSFAVPIDEYDVHNTEKIADNLEV